MGWWIALGIVVALILLSIIRFGGQVVYSESGLTLYITVWRLRKRITIKTDGEKAEKKKRADKKKDKKADEPKEKGGGIGPLREILSYAVDSLKMITRHIYIDPLDVQLAIATPDAASTALIYGASGAAVGLFMPFIDSNFRVGRKRICIEADFDTDEPRVYIRAGVSIRPCWIIILAFSFIYFYFTKLRNTKKEKAV